MVMVKSIFYLLKGDFNLGARQAKLNSQLKFTQAVLRGLVCMGATKP